MTLSLPSQSLALALASVVFATLPTVAGFFPLWLAVSLHEGSTVLVALNSLRCGPLNHRSEWSDGSIV